MLHLTRTLILAFLTTLLIACGGGGGGGGDDSSPSSNNQGPSINEPEPQPEPEPEPQPEPEPEPQPEPEPEPQPEPPATKSVTLSWIAPSSRANGDPLELSEISGYAIYYFKDGSSAEEGEAIIIENPSATEYTTPQLTLGTYFFAIATIDDQNLYSDTSDYIETLIE